MAEMFVHHPGFLTTIQDLGRPRYAHLGISASGAADPVSLRIGNALVGNAGGAPALEMTLMGGVFEFDSDVLCAIVGSDFSPRVDGNPVPLWQSIHIKRGEKLSFGTTTTGARCYLCVRGGIEVPPTLESASTHLQSRIGGLEGRPLRAGDRLQVGSFGTGQVQEKFFRYDRAGALLSRDVLRVTRGLQFDLFTTPSQKTFTEAVYTVSEETNRMGIRMRGEPVHLSLKKDILTQGVPLGAIQIPPSGQPIILFVEHQTTGGYPLIATVCSADLHRLGQLRPRDRVRFEMISFDMARSILLEQEHLITSNILSR